MIVCWFVFAIVEAREAARQSACKGRLAQLGLALENYHYVYGSFPPAYIADETGKPMHSWRVLLLPFFEQRDAYEDYDFNEPWNGPNNGKASTEQTAVTFRCPGHPYANELHLTDYVAVTGPKTVFTEGQSKSLSDIRDDTILLLEIPDSDIHWMEPRDLGIEDALKIAVSSRHPMGAAVLRANSSVVRIDPDTSEASLREMFSISRREDAQ
ncbi:MAG: DUF1559 domain-containing protein [Planctomycetaceae bacterium]|nr:DUF1559 domain-containing protein [Planctomycetaceae bacterium]